MANEPKPIANSARRDVTVELRKGKTGPPDERLAMTVDMLNGGWQVARLKLYPAGGYVGTPLTSKPVGLPAARLIMAAEMRARVDAGWRILQVRGDDPGPGGISQIARELIRTLTQQNCDFCGRRLVDGGPCPCVAWRASMPAAANPTRGKCRACDRVLPITGQCFCQTTTQPLVERFPELRLLGPPPGWVRVLSEPDPLSPIAKPTRRKIRLED